LGGAGRAARVSFENVSAHRSHLAAIRCQASLLSGSRVNLAMASHSLARFLNSSDGTIA
jgi:hypothetical protein